jgi:Cu/Ag efflux pump CusA
VLSAWGATLNMMIVAGLVMALAVIVDDGIVDINNIRRRLQQRRAEGGSASVIDTIVAASLEMRGPILTAFSIVIVSVVPVLVLGEVSGDFVKPLALSYALAVLVSMLVALTLTPALAVALLSRGTARDAESPLADRLGRGYLALLGAVVQRPVWMAAAAAVVALGGLGVLAQLGSPSLAPALQDRHLLVRWEGLPGASLSKMSRIAAAASKELRSIPGVRNVGGNIGRASASDKVASVDTADLWVSIDPAADYAATVGAVKRLLAEGYPGLRTTVTTYPDMRIREVTAGTEHDLVVRVYGRDYKVLREKAEELAKSISGVAGVVDPQVKLPALEPTVEVEVDVPKAAANGMKPGDIRRAAATMVSGITAGTMFEEQKIFDVVVWGKPDKRDSLTSIRELLIDTPGGQVRLEDLADVRIRPNPSVIKHDAVSRYMDVTAQVRGRSLDAVTGDVKARIKGMTFPAEHHVEVLGEAAERRTTQRYLLTYAIAALVAVFFLLQARFSSWRLAALLFALLPVPLAGAALAASLLPGIPSVLSLMGGLTVLAVAVRGGILLIARYRRLEQEEGEAFGPDLVLRGSRQRFGAIMLSTLAAAVTLVPLLVYGAVSGLEIVAPLAAVVLGGLLAAALLNLFVLPALYLRFGVGARPEASGV